MVARQPGPGLLRPREMRALWPLALTQWSQCPGGSSLGWCEPQPSLSPLRGQEGARAGEGPGPSITPEAGLQAAPGPSRSSCPAPELFAFKLCQVRGSD